MKIEVIGSGCKKCKALFELTKEVSLDLGITETVLYSDDVSKIVSMGVMSSPVLAIDDQPVLVGVLPDKEKLKQIISVHIPCGYKSGKVEKNKCSGCSCNGNC